MYMCGQFDAGSQKLLDNAERYALYLAEALDDDDRQRRVWQTNNMGKHNMYTCRLIIESTCCIDPWANLLWTKFQVLSL